MLAGDAVLGEDRVHTVLQRRAHPGQRDPVAQQLAQVAQLAWSDVRLGQQIGAQQMRERLRVNRVRLHPGGGDRPRTQRVREMDLVAGVLEQLRQPLPAVGRLDRDPRFALEACRAARGTSRGR